MTGKKEEEGDVVPGVEAGGGAATTFSTVQSIASSFFVLQSV